MKPLVSIIVAIYNVGAFLRECVDSIINQSLKDIEIILVDDGSKDESPAICDEYAKKESRIKVIHQENAGVSVARNNGISASSADWIMMVDGDDWLSENAAEILYNTAVKNKGSDIVIGTYYENYAHSEYFAGKDMPLDTEYVYELDNCRKEMLSYVLEEVEMPELRKIKCNLSSPWAKLYRTAYLRENNITFVPGQRRAQDEVFNMYAFEHAKKITVINNPVYHYRLWENSICRRINAKKVSLDIYDMWHEQVRIFLKKYGYEEKLRDVYFFYVMNLLTAMLKSYVNGYWDKSISYREMLDGIKGISEKEDCRGVIGEFKGNRYSSRKTTMMSTLWRKKMYRTLFWVCTVYRVKTKIKSRKM